MNPLAVGIVIVLGILILVLPRAYVVIPLLVSASYVTLGQELALGPLDFGVVRLMVSFGWLRLLVRRELKEFTFHRLDLLIVLYALVTTIMHTLLIGNMDGFINRLGVVYNALGLYFLYRATVRTHEEAAFAVRALAIMLMPLAVFMVVEFVTGKNFFHIFGGVARVSGVRYGRVRAQGPFAHPILAGMVGGTSLGVILSQVWYGRKEARIAIGGAVACTIIAFTAGSSGALLALLASLVATVLWWVRPYMRQVRLGVLAGLFALSLIMKAPVYYVIARISEITGGTGWHRSYLIDRAIYYLDEWWLMGTTYTAHWMPTALPANPDMCDLTNHYIYEGVDGGILAMLLFAAIQICAFSLVGIGMWHVRKAAVGYSALMWGLGASLFAHATAMISVAYFDQIIVFYYMVLGMIGSCWLPRPDLAAATEAATDSAPTAALRDQPQAGMA